MRKILVRLLKLFVKLGFIGKVVSFRYKGPSVSLNKFYSQGHWSERSKIKNQYRDIFMDLLAKAKDKIWMDQFFLLIFYNTRHDVDNVIGMEKIFTDCLKGKFVKNDGRSYYKGLMIFYDANLPNDTFEFILIENKEIGKNDGKYESSVDFRSRAKADSIETK